MQNNLYESLLVLLAGFRPDFFSNLLFASQVNILVV